MKDALAKIKRHPFAVAAGAALLWALYKSASPPSADEILQDQALGANPSEVTAGRLIDAGVEGGIVGVLALLVVKVAL